MRSSLVWFSTLSVAALTACGSPPVSPDASNADSAAIDAVSNDGASGDAIAPSPCPPSLPMANAACAREALVCQYGADPRERVRQAMRWAGPRMLLRHPVLAVRHLLDGKRPAPRLPEKH